MYVYLKFESFPSVIKVISNVTINEDCGPIVDGKLILYTPTETTEEVAASSQSTIDAISWFKALPMEAVYIDCSTREAKWCLRPVLIRDSAGSVQMRSGQIVQPQDSISPGCPDSELPFMPDSARPLYAEQTGVMAFNPVIDEMFECLARLYDYWTELCERGDINKEIAKFLHCYVFPAVTFEKDDIPVLEECLRLIAHKQEAIEKEIVHMEKNIDITEAFANKMKEVILNQAKDDMTTQAYLQACSEDFVSTFYVHVMKDIQDRNMTLDILQININDLKKRGQDPKRVEKLQNERDAIHEAVLKLLSVREAMRTHLYRHFIPKKAKRQAKRRLDQTEASMHVGFLSAHHQLVEHKDCLKTLCYKKLHIASVREAIESTVRTLRNERTGSLGDFTEFSIHSEGSTYMKQWKSMQTQVDGWMSWRCSLNNVHLEGCQLIKDLADGMLSDSQIASMGADVMETNVKGDDCGLQDGGVGRDGATTTAGLPNRLRHRGNAGAYQDISSYRCPMVQVMSEQVSLHLLDMAETIVNRMNLADVSPSTSYLNRAWACYSPHFWKEAGEAVEQVYSHYHASRARQIFRQVSSAALADILDSRFFQEVFIKGMSSVCDDSEPEVGVRRLEATSAASLDLQRCSVSDLYALANRDGAKVNCHIMDLEMLTRSVSLDSHGSSTGNDPDKSGKQGDSINTHGSSTASNDKCCVEETVDGNDEKQGSLQGAVSISSTASCDRSCVGETASGEDTHGKHGPLQGAVTINDVHPQLENQRQGHSVSSSSSDASVHSGDLDSSSSEQHHSSENSDTIRSSQTVASVLSLFDYIVNPYHEKVRDVLKAPDIMAKMDAVFKSVDFLSKKTGEVCKARGMDSLLPMSIFATTSFPEELFVSYFIQLLILLDLRPSFAMHSAYDFSLTNAFSTYMFLFEARFSGAGASGGQGS